MVLKICDVICKDGQVITDNILFLHAWSGCDTTSATFGHGKTTLLKKIKESGELQQISSLMYDPDATAEQIGKAGNRLSIILYGDKQEDSLNRLRYAKFMEMVSSAKTFHPLKEQHISTVCEFTCKSYFGKDLRMLTLIHSSGVGNSTVQY